jgi:hypothetical protein
MFKPGKNGNPKSKKSKLGCKEIYPNLSKETFTHQYTLIHSFLTCELRIALYIDTLSGNMKNILCILPN